MSSVDATPVSLDVDHADCIKNTTFYQTRRGQSSFFCHAIYILTAINQCVCRVDVGKILLTVIDGPTRSVTEM